MKHTRVYYLTSSQHALSNIAFRRIKISRISNVNDPFEFLAVNLTDVNHQIEFQKIKEETNKNIGLICFARDWGNPVMWGHYASGHTGMALGFDVEDEFLKPAIYSKIPINIQIHEETGKMILVKKAVDKLIRTKFYDWKYENELRLFVKLDHTTVESDMYFKDFDSNLILREVILGSRCELPIAGIRTMLNSYTPSVKVIKSKIALNSFHIVED